MVLLHLFTVRVVHGMSVLRDISILILVSVQGGLPWLALGGRSLCVQGEFAARLFEFLLKVGSVRCSEIVRFSIDNSISTAHARRPTSKG